VGVDFKQKYPHVKNIPPKKENAMP